MVLVVDGQTHFGEYSRAAMVSGSDYFPLHANRCIPLVGCEKYSKRPFQVGPV